MLERFLLKLTHRLMRPIDCCAHRGTIAMFGLDGVGEPRIVCPQFELQRLFADCETAFDFVHAGLLRTIEVELVVEQCVQFSFDRGWRHDERPTKEGADNRGQTEGPKPGFSKAQYRMLAALYVYASARAGHWLIPAFHATVDAGIPDAHDDPQNFELKQFAAELEKLLKG